MEPTDAVPSPNPGPLVTRLIYASVSKVQGSVLDEMRRIRDHAVLRNAEHDIRVALLYMSGWFLEWIEGPEHGVHALLQRVAQDPRHDRLKVIHRSAGRPRLFRPWIGSIVQTTDARSRLAERVVHQHTRYVQGDEQEPASVWLALCSPPDPDMPAPQASSPRVMMVSARQATAFDLLEWLARKERRTLVRRRFAGAADEAPDVESDYLDLPGLGSRGLRLIANARGGLAMGMTHAFLPDYAAVVLLLDTDPAYNLPLVERVLEACDQVNHCPVMVGLGAHGSVTPELVERLQRAGLRWVDARSPLAVPELSDLWEALEPVLQDLG